MTTRIEARYTVTTPLFCAGADPKEPEVRLPSFKGLLRFWWRALAWSRLGGKLAVIREKEEELFGSSRTGQSCVLFKLTPAALPPPFPPKTVLKVHGNQGPVVGDGVRYLGYGVMEAFPNKKKNTKAGELTRACFPAPFDFSVELTCRKLSNPSLLIDALKALGLLGGMGAKNRKGFGSLVLRSLTGPGGITWKAPETPEELKKAILDLYAASGSLSNDWPEYTALSGRSRHVLLMDKDDHPAAMKLLDRIGRELIRYRSWGKGGRILGGEESEKNFEVDHDLMKKPHDQRSTHPRRIAFGLPHNYGKTKDLQVEPADSSLDRRASPLFIHLHLLGESPAAVVSFLPARFLPQNKNRVSVGGKTVTVMPEEELYRPVTDFLDRLLDTERGNIFSQRMEASP